MLLGFQGSVIKMLIVGFDFLMCVQFICHSGYQGLRFCQVKDSSNLTGFNFRFSRFSEINVRRCYLLNTFYYLRRACFIPLYSHST